jgi:transcription-repair coupling factor (superfamily II helicase)
MGYFQSLQQKLKGRLKEPEGEVQISGLSSEHWLFIFNALIHKDFDTPSVLIFPNIEEAEELFEKSKQYSNDTVLLLYPGNEFSPYSGFYASEKNLLERFFALSQLSESKSKKKHFIIFTTIEAFNLKGPTPDFFHEYSLTLEVSDIIDPYQLSKKLQNLGYSYAPSVEEPGTYCRKGEIFDLFPINSTSPIRLHYFDDMIEEIYSFDQSTGRTNKERPLEKALISCSPYIFGQSQFSQKLRELIPSPGPQFRKKFEKRKLILEKLGDNQLFENFPFYIPLFINKTSTLKDFLPKDALYHFIHAEKSNEAWLSFIEELREDYGRAENQDDPENLLPPPEYTYELEPQRENAQAKIINIDEIEIHYDFNESLQDKIKLELIPSKNFLSQHVNPILPKHEFLKESFNFLKEHFKYAGNICFIYRNKNSRAEIEHLLEVIEAPLNLKERISFIHYELDRGFYYENEKVLFLTEGDLFSRKKSKAKVQKNNQIDLFAEQLATLTIGDFVIHNEHGVGKYLGLEALDTPGQKSDFLIIQYSGKDKIYVPVYKMNLVQKHADASQNLNVASLRTNKFNTVKKRASESAKKLAFDLLKLQAERESSQAFSFSPPDHLYKEFELSFPFQETPDQTHAIDDVLDNMQKARPMDHLVCGDVGFGKTEVAMRAAYKAVLDGKQVAILVPTTILALQHYHSFVQRFKKFPVEIDFLSRFKSPKESKQIIEKLESGKIDILIGTHKLLSGSVKFSDLGLVVVDEEQRFGVGHKEKLKLLKANVDFLTLTATPIPRTLQMSFLGLRDLSLIKTPPPKRQSIKSYLIKEDDLTLQNAIKKELSRGGQIFIVHNRVNDIEQYAAYIRELAPGASIVIAHGQLPEKELEKRIQAFYQGEFQILVATTIIESGIDIPNANTMIIDKANQYGLSQLHQLRGRIGRSDRKAYAYFVIPKNQALTIVAEKRLKALQTYADMGSGFNIATSDLEIRGAGDLLGPNQSGHIEAIGLELYMELLRDAINELKGTQKIINKNIEIITPFSAYIPNDYILDSHERLKQYKRLSNSSSVNNLEDISEEYNDVYGVLPEELKNLFSVLKSRVILGPCGIKQVQLAGPNVSLFFDRPTLEKNPDLNDKVLNLFLKNPQKYQFSPDYKVLYKGPGAFGPEQLIEFCLEIAEKIVPC